MSESSKQHVDNCRCSERAGYDPRCLALRHAPVSSKEQILTWLNDADMCVKLAACGESKAFVDASRLIKKARAALSGDSSKAQETVDRLVNERIARGVSRPFTPETRVNDRDAAAMIRAAASGLKDLISRIESKGEKSHWWEALTALRSAHEVLSLRQPTKETKSE